MLTPRPTSPDQPPATPRRVRQIVKIDEEKCTGCGICVPACAEGAIQLIDGKARLVSDNLCDGLGACLGDCPEDAITIEERPADDFDEAAVEAHLGTRPAARHHAHPAGGNGHGQAVPPHASEPPAPDTPRLTPAIRGPAGPHGSTGMHLMGGGCPGSRVIHRPAPEAAGSGDDVTTGANAGNDAAPATSQLRQWPIQLHLVPPTAPYYQNADVLLVADCVPLAVADFHERFLKGHAIAVACPKLDQGQEIYLEKLTVMIDQARINTLSVLVMEVPCCTGLLHLTQTAVSQASRKVPVKLVRVGLKGELLEERWV